MNARLDRLVERLAATPTERSLESFDAEIGRDVGRWRAQARMVSALAPIRLASIGVALATGVAVGGLTAASLAAPHSAGGLTAAASLAPSSLLEGEQ